MERFIEKKSEARIPEFHAIPKVHKTPWTLRPIVPSHSWVTSRVSEVVDHLCRPILAKLPWVVDSSKQVINNLGQIRIESEDVWICTGDVVAFYTNINADACADILAGAWKKYLPDSKIGKKTISQMVHFVMKNNYFAFQGEMWKQVDGLAMGTSCAPLLANIYAAYFERKHRLVGEKGVLLYNRYIDDILLIFQGTRKELTSFLNKVQLGRLTVNWDISSEKGEFLDVELLKNPGLRGPVLDTRLFRKKMNRFLYIPWSSAHPLHVKKAFVKAELSRFAILCSKAEYFADARIQLYGNLRRRGYPPQALEDWFKQVSYDDRPLLLAPAGDEEEAAPLMLSGQYNPVWEYIKVDEVIRAAREGWSLERNLPDALQAPLIRSLRRHTSLFDLMSTWNKTVLHPVMLSSETGGNGVPAGPVRPGLSGRGGFSGVLPRRPGRRPL